ncbi:6-phosphogluconolactonase [Kushneria phosphatilytica]|uniref:6-phosphogluconolactonase n=2 Tax=Kushneria phosphatilytica TaxID=657387 RepID=A0A1S1NV09_9GAMM|nr:6-phosphogluconolactonase [Kushneria phosphatilytica]QEL12863.1 6-phosphogluconolactonase [Kushneria phosphatilytica]
MQDERTRLAQALAEAVAEALREDLAQQSRALLVVSGGSTPVPFFEALAGRELDWSRVDITLADERWVASDHKDSNEQLVRKHLLTGPAAAASYHTLTTADDAPEAGVHEVSERIAALSWPASAVILGMGGDGHTASLFPDSPQLEEGLTTEAVALAVHAPSVSQGRISLSRHRLIQARRHFLHIAGDDKRAMFARAFGGEDARELPIRAFLGEAIALYWAP